MLFVNLQWVSLPVAIYSIVLLMMGEIFTRNMQSKAIANKKRNCCILLDLFHQYTQKMGALKSLKNHELLAQQQNVTS